MLKNQAQKPSEKENEAVKKAPRKPSTVGKDPVLPSTSGTQASAKGGAAKAGTAKQYDTEMLGILKELSSNQNKINDKMEKLTSRVDSLYEPQNYECDVVHGCPR